MYDSAMAIQEIYKILIQDGTISDQKKEQLTQDLLWSSIFVTGVVSFKCSR